MKQTKIVKKTASKITNHSVTSSEIANSHSWYDAIDKEAFIFFPSKHEWRQKLIYTMEKFSESPDSLTVLQFTHRYKIPYQTLVGWLAKYPDLKEAYGLMKSSMAMRRQVGAIKNDLNMAAAYKDMHRYDPTWGKEVDQYHADLKKEEEKQAHTFVVNVGRPKVQEKEVTQEIIITNLDNKDA